MATPSLAMIPSAYADSKVYSVLPNNGDGDFTFNRDSSATRVGQNGLIQEVGFFGNELVTNGDFATDSDWTKGSTTTISGGQCTFTASGVAQSLIQGNLWAANSLSGKTVKLTYTIISNNLNVALFRVGGFSSASGFPVTDLNSEAGTHTVQLVITSSGGTDNAIDFYIQSTATTGALVLDNVSVKEVTGDQPRLNYDISNGVVQSCPSLLLEPASTNLVTYSEDYSQWTKQNNGTGSAPSITSNDTISPDGTQNADKVVFDKGTGITTSDLSILTTSFTSQSNTASIYIKADSPQRIVIRNSSTWIGYDIGTEWTRIEKTDTGGSFQIGLRDGYGVADVPNTATVYLWGGQVEALSYATSYIPTNGSSQTRAAETCNGAGNAATFNSTEGVLYAEISALVNDNDGSKSLSLSSGNYLDNIIIQYTTNTNQIVFKTSPSYSTPIFQSFTVSDITQYSKIAFSFKNNNCSFWHNGVKLGSVSSFTPFSSGTLSVLNFNRGDGGEDFEGKTKSVAVYNEALTDAQLQTLTTL